MFQNENSIKVYIKSHILIYDALLKARSYMSINTQKCMSLIHRISKVDSILDYNSFCDIVRFLKAHPEITLNRYDSYGREALRNYGYYQELLNYAKVEKTRVPYISTIEHGVRFGSQSWDEVSQFQYSISCACQGRGRISEAYSLYPWKPVFVLGPYIHYASPYYSDEKAMQMKNELGKVLLVFPSHSWEKGEKKVDNNLFDIVYKKYANDYDTVLVCAYWNDIDAPILDLFAQNGATIVSAGFRNDPNFIRRLKTIISLADEVVVDDIGTNIGFCKYMNKPVFLECSSSRFPNDKYFTENFERFHEAFFSQNGHFTEKQFQQQEDLYNFFWGGKEYLKTAEEVKDIFEVLKVMCKETHYNINKMPDFIRTHCTGTNIERSYQLLADAVSPSVWQNI